MNSGVPWQAKGVRREAMETAREAARRSGMSVAEWLDTVIAESTRNAGDDAPGQERPAFHEDPPVQDEARSWRRRHSDHEDRQGASSEPGIPDVNARLDALTRQIESLAHARHSADSEIDPRASGIDRAVGRIEPVGTDDDQATPVDQALAEIEARQRALDGEAPAPRMEFARAPTQRLPDLEHQLRQINSRMETLRPCGLDHAVDTLRDDLAEIGVMLKDAVPRQSIEALETEVRSLGDRIDNKRHAGVDEAAMGSLERGLAEVRDVLRGLSPAENFAGFDETMQGLSQKIDRLSGATQDPDALRQLEDAIIALRGTVSHAASGDGLAALSEEVRALSHKVDQAAGASDAFSTIERRIGSLTELLQRHGNGSGQDTRELEAVVASLVDKIEQLHSAPTDQTAVRHLEDRIMQLVEKVDASDARLNQLGAIERGLADLLIYIEHQQNFGRGAFESPEADTLKRDVQRTQDSLESVHGALGQVVDRLATIESSIREAQLPRAANILEKVPDAAPIARPIFDAPPAPEYAPPAPDYAPPVAVAPAAPEYAPPAAIALAAPSAPVAAPARVAPPPAPARQSAPPANASPPVTVNPSPAPERKPIDPNLPPDHPLEPGAVRGRNAGSPTDRIAASEAALENVRPPVIPDPGGKSNFIQAARRAAQAAMVEAPPPKDKAPVGVASVAGVSGVANLASSTAASIAGKIGGKARKIMVGVGLILFILGALHFVATRILFSSGSPEQAAQVPLDDAPTATPPRTEPAAPKTDRQSALVPPGYTFSPGPLASVTGLPTTAPAARDADRDATGSIRQPTPQAAITQPPVPAPTPQSASAKGNSNGADRLPPGIGSGGLRAAAARGDAAAEFEIASRFADGRGVPQNLTEAAAWFERAASKGLVPAQFRLGGLYEKGMGVRKNTDTARRLYLSAAEAGNAKAMHNLAVLYAEGIDGKADYPTAARWFRKAADHGVIDAQYNLAILYARGIGVETNLAEAFKWFALATREGDREAARKRDDVAGRLDKQSLTAAMTAAQAWQPQPQPQAATQVEVPNGGWDVVPTPSTAKRSVGPQLDPSTRRPAQ